MKITLEQEIVQYIKGGCKMKKWEYMIEVTTKDYIPDLNKLGNEGWELITVVTLHVEEGIQDYKYFFKRAK